MTKQEFLTRLKSKLSVLSTEEVNELLDEYSEYIQNKISEGKSEQEAVSDFGNVDELAREILKAYKIDDQYTQKEDLSSQITNLLNEIASALTKLFHQLFDGISQRGFSNIIVLIIEAILLCILLRIPFWIIQILGDILLSILFPSLLEALFVTAWNILCEVGYTVFAIMLLIRIIKKGKNTSHNETANAQSTKRIIDAEYTEKDNNDHTGNNF